MADNNQISDLRDAMFNQLKRLQDENNNLDKEVQRTEAMVSVGNVIVASAKTEVDFMKVTATLGTGFIPNNKLLGDGKGD